MLGITHLNANILLKYALTKVSWYVSIIRNQKVKWLFEIKMNERPMPDMQEQVFLHKGVVHQQIKSKINYTQWNLG